MDWLVFATRVATVIAYLAVFVYAACTLTTMTGNWTRKAALVIFMFISAYWAGYYTYLIWSRWDVIASNLSTLAMLTRIGHYFTAAGMWIIVAFLRFINAKYEIVLPDDVDAL